MLAARPRRSAFTIMELMLVMVVVLLLGAILVPTALGMWSNNRTKAGADMLAGRLADARGGAIAEGRSYKVMVSSDGRQLKVEPDEPDQAAQSATASTTSTISQTDELPRGVVLTPKQFSTLSAPTDGWTTLVVFQADGTCPESAEVEVGEPEHTDVPTVTLRVRGMTGVVTANPTNATTPAGGRQ